MPVWQLIASIAATLLTLFGVPKLYFETSLASKSRMREEYRFIREIIGELFAVSPMHPFLRERACQALTGDRNTNPKNVEYLLLRPDADMLLRRYSNGKRYLESVIVNGVTVGLIFRGLYARNSVRATIKLWYVLLYSIPIFSLPFIAKVVSTIPHLHAPLLFGLVWYLAAVCLSFAILHRASKIVDAERLVSLLQRDTVVREPATAESA